MAIAIKTNMQSTSICRKNNPAMYYSSEDGGLTVAAIQSLLDGLQEVHKLSKPIMVDGVQYRYFAVNADRATRGLDINVVGSDVLRKNWNLGRGDYVTGTVLLMTEQEAA